MSIKQKIYNSLQQSIDTERIKCYLRAFTITGGKKKFLYYTAGLSLLFLIIQIITGVLLTLYYKPTAEDAFSSIQYINDSVNFGAWIRTLHHFSANALIISVITNLLHTIFIKAYKKPNVLLWYTGLFVVFIIFLFAFTGQILPWNELSYFGAVIGFAQLEKIPLLGSWLAAIIRGGKMVNGETLGRVFSIHAIILPLVITVGLIKYFVFAHLVKRNPDFDNSSDSKSVPVNYNFIYKILIVIVSGLAVVSVASLFLSRSIGAPYDISNPSVAPLGIHPDWYFMWVYQMFKFDTFLPPFAIIFLFAVIFLFLFFIPYFENMLNKPRGGNLIKVLIAILISYILIMTILGYINTGISMNEYSVSVSGSMGGIDRFSFAGIIIFTCGIMMLLLNSRIKKEGK